MRLLSAAVLTPFCALVPAAAQDGINSETANYLSYESLNSNDGKNPIRPYIDARAFRVRTCSEDNVSRNVCGDTTVGADKSIMAKWAAGGTAYLIDPRGYFLTAGHVTHSDVKSGEVVVDDLESWLQCPRDGGGTEKPQKNNGLFGGKIELVGYDQNSQTDFSFAVEEVAVLYDKEKGYDISLLRMADGKDNAHVGHTKAAELLFYPAINHTYDNTGIFAGFPFFVIKEAKQRASAIATEDLNQVQSIPADMPNRGYDGVRKDWDDNQKSSKNKSSRCDKEATDCSAARAYGGYSGSARMRVSRSQNEVTGVFGVVQGWDPNDGSTSCGVLVKSGMELEYCKAYVIVTRLNHQGVWPLLASIPPTDKMCGYIKGLSAGTVDFNRLTSYVAGSESSITALDQLALLNFLINSDDKQSRGWFYSSDFSGHNRQFKVRTDEKILNVFCKLKPYGNGGSEYQHWNLFNSNSKLSQNFVKWAQGIGDAYARECNNHSSVAIARAGAATPWPAEAVFAKAGDELLKGMDALEKYPPLARDPDFAGPETESLLDYAVRRFDEAERLIGSRPPDDANGDGWRRFVGAYEAYVDIEALDARTARQWGTQSAFMSYLQAYRASALYLQAKRDGNDEDRERSLALVAESLERAPENEIALSLAADMFADGGRDYEARELKAKAHVLALEHAEAAERAGEPKAARQEARAAAMMAQSPLINGMDLGQRKEVAKNADLDAILDSVAAELADPAEEL